MGMPEDLIYVKGVVDRDAISYGNTFSNRDVTSSPTKSTSKWPNDVNERTGAASLAEPHRVPRAARRPKIVT